MRALFIVLAWLAAALTASPAVAEPAGSVLRIVVPFGAGGTVATLLKEPVILDRLAHRLTPPGWRNW